MNHEAISKDKADKTMEIDTKKSKSQQKSSKSYPAVSSHISKPSNSKIKSTSAPIISRPDEVQQLSKISMDSELNYQLPISNSDIFTDTEILNKNALFQKNVATNYSINDCREYINFIVLKFTKYKFFSSFITLVRKFHKTDKIKNLD